MNRRIRGVNRLGLALVGLVLTVLGGLALARGLGAYSQDWAAARTPIVDANVRDFFAHTSPWIWWAVAAAGIVVALLGLRWLLAQARRDARRPVRLESGPAGVTEVSADGMAHALAADVESSPVVLSAQPRLAGAEARLNLVADEAAPMEELTRHLSTTVLPHLADALDRDRVPALARVSLEPSSAPHRVVR
ncbi:hypothetical protein ACFOY2_11645 [Nonomuraea purpurea]|uniref:Alkaline shock response membrane anchor protein AmaP n=1 Tax=Nonomuraea purpurea TaxID=1849276 RepID=A0ABV8G1N0_9ACTN